MSRHLRGTVDHHRAEALDAEKNAIEALRVWKHRTKDNRCSASIQAVTDASFGLAHADETGDRKLRARLQRLVLNAGRAARMRCGTPLSPATRAARRHYRRARRKTR